MLERAVAYINCDTGVVYNQLLVIGSSPLLFDSAYKTARKVMRFILTSHDSLIVKLPTCIV